MTGFEMVEIQRSSDCYLRSAIFVIGWRELSFLDIRTAKIGLFVDHVTNGAVIYLSRTKIPEGAPGTQVRVLRLPGGAVVGAIAMVAAADLERIDPGVEWLEKTTSCAGPDLIIRLMAKAVVK